MCRKKYFDNPLKIEVDTLWTSLAAKGLQTHYADEVRVALGRGRGRRGQPGDQGPWQWWRE